MAFDIGGDAGPPGYTTALDLAATQVSHEADQNRSHSDMTWAAQFNADQANTARAWQEMMANTAYQRTTKDMIAAGINPMLSAMHGPTSAPTTASPTVSPNTAYGGGPAGENVTAVMLSRAQSDLMASEAEKNRADADATRQTIQPNIELTQQKTEESRAAVQKLLQDSRTGAATATNLEQQTTNLKAQLPVLRATVQNLQALTTLHGEQANLAFKQAGLTVEQGTILQQEIQANLPKLRAALLKLEQAHSEAGLPQAQARASVYGAAGGNQGALLEFLNALPIPFTFKTYNINK